MAKDWAKPFYNSLRWIKARDSYIAKRMMIDGGMCEVCHKDPGYIVHHITALSEENIDDKDVTLNFNNFQYVCKSCHDEFEGHGAGGHGKAKAICMFDADGQPISLREIDRSGDQVAHDDRYPPLQEPKS